MKASWKKTALYTGIIAFFIILAYGFVPQVLTGKIVNQSDISGYVGMAHEANSWNDAHPDDRTAWTNSMFGGMPTTMLTENKATDLTKPLYDLLLAGKRPASYLFISLLGAFLLMLSFGISPVLAAGGAVAVTFCSYNMQIIQVGHNSKMLALAFAPWVLAAVVFTYKTALGSYHKDTAKNGSSTKSGSWLPQTLLGAVLFAIALGMQIRANHVQISYYLAIIIFSYVAVLAVWLCRKENKTKRVRFVAASALLSVTGIMGIATNANKLIPTYEYTKYTMRGGSELAAEESGSDNTKGLDLKYATSWSYGWEELPNLLIPNFNGGASSGAVNPEKSATVRLLRDYGQPGANEIAKALPLYWGPQPFTAGPMYMGAITVFLFVLGLCLYKKKEKWWLLIPTVIGIFLGVGYHFMGFTEFWYYHVPFYNKFRTVSMAIVILQLTLPCLGFLVLDRLFKGEYTIEQWKKSGFTAIAITGGFCLLMAMFPSLAGDFSGAHDGQMGKELAATLAIDRKALLVSDSWMALLQIVLVAGIITWYLLVSAKKSADSGAKRKLRIIAESAVALLVVINMSSIGKRYLNSGHFVSQRQFDSSFAARNVDLEILDDTEKGYRVVDLTVDPFNSSQPSYFHKNIGGYSPVKLQRYQDLIERYISGELSEIIGIVNTHRSIDLIEENMPELPVLSMLNDKYIILSEDIAVKNNHAKGAAWFVDDAIRANSAKNEIDLLGIVDLGTTAVIGKDFDGKEKDIQKLTRPDGGNDRIELVEYAPNRLTYRYNCETQRTAVFSEIYYPEGWKACIDGNEEIEIFRADWTLRAAILPAGEHEIVMTFQPESYSKSASITCFASVILVILLLLSVFLNYYPKLKTGK